MKVAASIVVYNTPFKEIKSILDSLYDSIISTVYLIDNSPISFELDLEKHDKLVYVFNGNNIGFGAGHNIAFKKSIESNTDYHFVVNPDVNFTAQSINELVKYISQDESIGLLMPRILNPDGTEQYLPKLLPRPIDMLIRKIKRPAFIYNRMIDDYELRFFMNKGIFGTPVISGCFSLFSIKAIKEIGMYDERYFMYMEDWDLSRRVNQKYQTIYYPFVSIIHAYRSEANFKFKLFLIFVRSAFQYFNKWGWFFDKSRANINRTTLNFCKQNFSK